MAISYIEPVPEASDPTRVHIGPSVSISGAAGIAAAGAFLLLVLDLIAPVPFVAPQIRGLALVVILVAAVIGATVWIDRRQRDRHREMVAAMDVRLRAACCAEAYVAGLARAPFPGRMD